MIRIRTSILIALLACSFTTNAAAEQHVARGLLGLVGADHVGITVPDIGEAIAWFEDILGCSAPLTFGPFSDPVGTFMGGSP